MRRYSFIFLKFKFILIVLGFISVISSFLGIVGTYISGIFIDTLVESNYAYEIIRVSVSLLVVFFLGVILRFLVGYFYGPLKEKIVFEFKKMALNQKNSNTNFEPSYLSKRLDEDTRQFTGFIVDNYATLIIRTVELLAVGFLIFRINFHIGIISLIVCPVYFLLYYVFRKPLYNKSADVREGSAQFFKNYTNYFDEALCDENNLENQFHFFYKRYRAYIFINILMNSFQGFLVAIMQIIIFIIGGIGVIRGSTTVGLLSILMVYFNQVLGIITYYLDLAKRFQITKASVHRLDELID